MGRTILTCHDNADFDAVCAMAGASLLYPSAEIFYPGSMKDEVAAFYEEYIKPLFPYAGDIPDASEIDAIVAVDVSKTSRISLIKNLPAEQRPPVIVFDHHLDGDINGPETHIAPYGSACTLITETLEKVHVQIPCEIATFLALGIWADTGNFCFDCACPEDFRAAARLRELGASPSRIMLLGENTEDQSDIKTLYALTEHAESYEVLGHHAVISVAIGSDGAMDIAGLMPRAVKILRADALFAVVPMGNKIQITARSSVEDINVGEICRSMGGGGHSYAASASVKGGTAHDAAETVLHLLSKLSAREKRAEELMSFPPAGVSENATMAETNALTRHFGLKAVPVFRDGTRQPLGILEAQTAARAEEHGLGDSAASLYMLSPCRVVARTSQVSDLLGIIVDGKQRLVPVTEDGTPHTNTIGVVTRTDLMGFLADARRAVARSDPAAGTANLGAVMRSRVPGQCLALMEKIGELASQQSLKAYIVGGFVRDLVTGTLTDDPYGVDMDIVIEGDGIEFAKRLSEQLCGTVKINPAFLTAKVSLPESPNRSGKFHIDVASSRIEYYAHPGALPVVERSPLKSDLGRRDFSINAMAICLHPDSFGWLADFYGGRSDIKNKIIRVLHSLSFVEDPTRIFRAVRFEQRYGFRMDEQTQKLLKNAVEAGMLDRVSGTRIRTELRHALDESEAKPIFLRMLDLRVFDGISHAFKADQQKRESLERCFDVLSWYEMFFLEEKANPMPLILLALCSGGTRKACGEGLERLAENAAESEKLLHLRDRALGILSAFKKLSGPPKPSDVFFAMQGLPIWCVLHIVVCNKNEAVKPALARYIYRDRGVKTDIGGNDLIAIGIPRGRLIGECLNHVLGKKIDGLAETRDAQMEEARRWLASLVGDPVAGSASQ